MKPGRGDMKEEIAEIHGVARSPSPTSNNKPTQRDNSATRKLSNGQLGEEEATGAPESKVKSRDTWINSEQNVSLDSDVPIHDQIKQGILGFIENEIKKTDAKPSYVFECHDPSGLEDRLAMKSLSRPSSGHPEKRSPSCRKKKRHSKRERELQNEFDVPGSSLSALEKVDDYLKEYNKDEIVTLSGDLDIEANDIVNNNGNESEARFKQRKTKRKTREDKKETSSNSTDVSPKVHAVAKAKHGNKSVRPKDLTSMFNSIDTTYQDLQIDNPFSSPSPVTTPSDGTATTLGRRPERVFLQNSGGGTFRAVSRTTLEDVLRTEENKYFRFGDLSPLDIALTVQRAWRNIAPACHGILAGVSLMHLLLITCTDGLDAGHLSFHSVVTMPYVVTYYFFCVLCLLSVLDRLDVTSMDLTRGLQAYFQPIVLVILYSACLLICTSARLYDEKMLLQYSQFTENATLYNVTSPTIPPFYNIWTHLSIWRAVLSILGLAYLIITNPSDQVYINLTKLLQFKQTLQPIG